MLENALFAFSFTLSDSTASFNSVEENLYHPNPEKGDDISWSLKE